MTMDLRARLRALESRLGVGQRPGDVRASPGSYDVNAEDATSDAYAATPAVSLAARMQRFASTIDNARRPARKRITDPDLAQLLGGTICADGVVLIEQPVPASARHGNVRYDEIRTAALDCFTGGVEPDRNDLVFIDTETTGLAGGTGTIAFLLGLARIRGESVDVRQYVLTRFAGEAAMLAHALEWLAPCAGRQPHLVSFNGKTFDVPLLATRYRMSRVRDPLADLPHIDLLHRTRAAFGRNWPDCRLQTAERELLRLFRDDDVPGHLIPQIWTDLLQLGETRHLRGVVEHNRTDLLSLVALAAVVGRAYAEPGHHPRADALGLARAHRKTGNMAFAVRHLERSVQPLSHDARLELAALYAGSGEWDKAVSVWTDLARGDVICAMERLAIYHEHKARDYASALQWADAMMPLAADRDAVERRRARLMRKSARSAAA